jgi:hypothetical protein
MGRLVARAKYLFEGAEKFYVRGVSYGPFAPNSRGEEYPELERVAADFSLMRQLGANVVRLYVPPPLWMVEEAQKAGLRLMVGIPWPYHMAFLDSRDMKRDIRENIRKTVAEMRQFGETIAAYSIGNEIRSDIVRWHGPRAVSGFLAELRDLGKQTEPDALFTYSNYPSTEYLDLSFLDFISFNVYLHREDDFRRYFTHLLGQAGELPLILSETGMDTIREGEDHQAELLAWQGQAAFELGLGGFIVFAFTDEWHRGGAEITDWAFGLTHRDRTPKPAFEAVARIFANEFPPKLIAAPKASVVVPAYNAAATLGDCLASLRTLNYPNYETIVVDDGSTDSTAQIAEQDGAQTIRLEHRGLAAARNAGVEAASGEIIAFIDADACADRDWLYHLVETITRRDAAAASGPNFAPTPPSARAAAMASAPGLPREVRARDADLAQLCGCNMALSKAALTKIGGFDPAFTTAGDDVDLSWRVTASGETLAYAPGAVVIHERRATLSSYIAQQRGYGKGEGLLAKRYPLRDAAEDGIYAAPSWIAAILGGARVYYGEFGRGLFQTVYSAGDSYGELPLTIQWIAVSVVCLILGTMNRFLGVIGGAGITITFLAAAARAASTPLPKARSGFAARIYLWILNLLGPPIRSLARERIKWKIETARSDQFEPVRATPSDSSIVLASCREALIRHGLAVAETDGFQSYDLEIVVPPLIRMPINAVREKDGHVSLLWRTRVAPRRALIVSAIALLVLLAAGLSLRAASAALILAAIAIAVFAFLRARRVSEIVERCANEITNQHRISLSPATAGKA